MYFDHIQSLSLISSQIHPILPSPFLKTRQSSPGLVAYTFNSRTQETKTGALKKFEVSLLYAVSSKSGLPVQ